MMITAQSRFFRPLVMTGIRLLTAFFPSRQLSFQKAGSRAITGQGEIQGDFWLRRLAFGGDRAAFSGLLESALEEGADFLPQARHFGQHLVPLLQGLFLEVPVSDSGQVDLDVIEGAGR